jgi:hypothetical protein
MLSIRRSQTSWLGSFIVHVRTGMTTLSVLFVKLFYYLPEDFKQAGGDPSSGSKEQVLPTLSILFVKLFYYLPEDLKQACMHPSLRTYEKVLRLSQEISHAIQKNRDSNKIFILNSHRPFICSVVYLHTRLAKAKLRSQYCRDINTILLLSFQISSL